MIHKALRLVPTFVLAVFVGLPLMARAAPTIEEFWRPTAYASPLLSPNGKHVAVAVPVNGRLNLGVLDLEKRSAVPLTNFRDFDVLEYRWVGDDRLVFSLGSRNSPTGPEAQDGAGLFAVSRDGKEQRVLSPTIRDAVRGGAFIYRGLNYLRGVPGSKTEIFAAGLERSINTLDVYRVDIVTGRKELVTSDNPGRVVAWLLDRNGVPRLATSSEDKSTVQVVRYRDGADKPWRELWRHDVAAGPLIVPLGFQADNRSLYVATAQGRDTMAIHAYDPVENKLGEQLAAHPRFDLGADQGGAPIGSLLVDEQGKDIRGFRIAAEREQVYWLDPDADRIQKSLDAAMPGRVNRLNYVPGAERLLVSSYSDRESVRWFLLDPKKMALEELAASRPWLKPADLVEMRPFTYKTRDGLEIPSYYFLPKDHKPGQKLPTVIHIHGGPWVRADSWGYGSFGTREGQLLASRGYAVVVPNFRGTPGFGSKIFYSARRQFGKAMQEDIEDVTDWAVQQGFADPSRICLSGASYGGYASLMGIAKTPDRYRCAIAGLAVTDLELLMTSGSGDIPRSDAPLAFWMGMVGDPAKDRQALRAVSPAYLAEQMKAPVLMYSGGADIRVPLEQPQRMRSALEARGKPPVWIVEPEEGHGFGVTEKNVKLYERILTFLDQHLGAGQAR